MKTFVLVRYIKATLFEFPFGQVSAHSLMGDRDSAVEYENDIALAKILALYQRMQYFSTILRRCT